MINIVNKRTHIRTKNDVYVGRGSPLGNQWGFRDTDNATFRCDSRMEAIGNYAAWLRNKLDDKDKEVCAEMNRIYKMAAVGDVNLVCYCAPLNCHAEIIKEIIEKEIPPRKDLTAGSTPVE